MSKIYLSRRKLIAGSILLLIVALCGVLLFKAQKGIAQEPDSSLPPIGNNLFPGLPLPSEIAIQQAQIASQRSQVDGAPPWNRTSDYMLGTVAVSIILPQCTGSVCTESWTTAEISEVRSEVESGLQWWQQKAAEANVSLEFRIIPESPLLISTSVEPINIPGGGPSLCGNEKIWVDEVMANLGYDNYPSTGNQYLNEVREYDDDLRQTNGTDWAVTVFVADASNDAQSDPVDGSDGRGKFRFTDCNGAVDPPFGVMAYAWILGPHIVMNTHNDGYGSQFKDGVLAHEIGHTFGAPDEWNAPYSCNPPGEGPSCNDPWGYLSVPNGNCNYNNDPNNATCIVNDNLNMMRAPHETSPGSGIIDNIANSYTQGHMGWQDSNSNGIADPVDTTPVITVTDIPSSPTTDHTPTYMGIVEDIPAPTTHPDYVDVTINDVAVEFRVNGGGWGRGVPTDGAFDSPYEEFSFTILSCEGGTYNIEARAVNAVGNVSATTFSHQITVQQSPDICQHTYLPLVMKGHTSIASMMLPLPQSTPAPAPYPAPTEPSLPLPPSAPLPAAYPPPSYSWTFSGWVQRESTGQGLAGAVVQLYRNVLGYFQAEDSATTTGNGQFSLEYTAEQSDCLEFALEESDPAGYLSTGAAPGNDFTHINHNLLFSGCLPPGAYSGHTFYDDTHIVIGEVGYINDTLTHTPKTVVLSRAYANPVVFAQPISRDGGDKSVVRITDVQADRFTLYVDEAPNHGSGAHTTEAVSYVVLEAGSWELPDGSRLEAGQLTTSATVGRNVANQWAQVIFNPLVD